MCVIKFILHTLILSYENQLKIHQKNTVEHFSNEYIHNLFFANLVKNNFQTICHNQIYFIINIISIFKCMQITKCNVPRKQTTSDMIWSCLSQQTQNMPLTNFKIPS